jgi:hypothetical protein
MNEGRKSDLPLDRLLDQLDRKLESGMLDADLRASASVALGLCELAKGQFNEEQTMALDVARRWLSGGGETDREHWRHVFARKVVMGHPLPAADRLVLCAVNAGSGVDIFKAEFLAGLGSDLGQNATEIASAFSREIPDFTLE